MSETGTYTSNYISGYTSSYISSYINNRRQSAGAFFPKLENSFLHVETIDKNKTIDFIYQKLELTHPYHIQLLK